MCRPWWRNCAVEADPEIAAIDELEDRLTPLPESATKIRELISSLELCHHKAERWVHNILAAIGGGHTAKGLGTRPSDEKHPVEEIWENAIVTLADWAAGRPAESVDLMIGAVPASRILEALGPRTRLKEWQVQRVIEKIRSVLHWPLALEDPTARYEWLLLGGGDYDTTYRERCPERFRKHEAFWYQTVCTLLCEPGPPNQTGLSLGIAIDMLWPCHWAFPENLELVAAAIGGKLETDRPFMACGRAIDQLPDRRYFERAVDSLASFCGDPPGRDVDAEILELLGERTEVKLWLAASLSKTIRLQIDPPVEVRAAAVLPGPDWIRQ